MAKKKDTIHPLPPPEKPVLVVVKMMVSVSDKKALRLAAVHTDQSVPEFARRVIWEAIARVIGTEEKRES